MHSLTRALSIKSHFGNESINLNFVLVSHCFENITEALKAHYRKKTRPWHRPQKGKRNVKIDSTLVFDSLKAQSFRLTCSYRDNLNYAYFSEGKERSVDQAADGHFRKLSQKVIERHPEFPIISQSQAQFLLFFGRDACPLWRPGKYSRCSVTR